MADVRGLRSFPELRPARSPRMGRRRKTRQKKGPLAGASGPSLGRKRPRRAAVTRGATAPQQHATAAHKKQVFLTYYLYNFCMAGLPDSGAGDIRRGLPFSAIISMAYMGNRGPRQRPVQVAFQAVSSKGEP